MKNEFRQSATLLGAVCLMLCGMVGVAVGVGMASVPVQRSLCLSTATAQIAEVPLPIVVPTLYAITIVMN